MKALIRMAASSEMRVVPLEEAERLISVGAATRATEPPEPLCLAVERPMETPEGFAATSGGGGS